MSAPKTFKIKESDIKKLMMKKSNSMIAKRLHALLIFKRNEDLIFLNEFSINTPNEFIILFLDNGSFHKAQK